MLGGSTDCYEEQEKEFFATQFAEDAKRQREMKKPPVKQASSPDNTRYAVLHIIHQPKQVESDTDTSSSEESDIPLKQLPPVAKTLIMRGQKRKNTLVSSDVCSFFCLFIIVSQGLDDNSPTLIHRRIAH